MKTIGAFSAKTHLSELLEQVSRGESFLITKRGKPMAALSPVTVPRKPGPKASLVEFRKKYAKSLKKYSVQELKELIGFGRR